MTEEEKQKKKLERDKQIAEDDVFEKKINKQDAEEKKRRKKEKDEKSFNNVMNAFKLMFILYLFLFVLVYAVNKYAVRPRSIYSKIGSNYSGTSVSMQDAYTIKEYTINKYKNLLLEGKLEDAYNMMSDEYKKYMDYESYVESLKGIDYKSIDMMNIKAKSNYALEARVTYLKNNERVETTYMLYPSEFNSSLYYMSPDNFLYYYENQDMSQDGLTVHVSECVCFVNAVEIRGTVKNDSWFDKIELTQMAVSYDNSLNKWTDYEVTLEKGQEAQFDFRFEDLHYFVPNSVQIKRKKGDDKVRTYFFEFKEDEKRS